MRCNCGGELTFELLAGQRVNVVQQRFHAALQVHGHLAQIGAVQRHAAPLDGHQYVDQRHFHIGKQACPVAPLSSAAAIPAPAAG